MLRRYLPVFIALGAPLLAVAVGGRPGADDKIKDLQARPFTLKGKDIALSEALDKLQAQTGNQVVDRRRNKAAGKVSLDLDQVSFWQGLEAIGQAAGAGVSLYEADGRVALVDRPSRRVPTVHAGLFRLALKRISTTRDEDAGTHTCGVHLEVAWEPRFQPFYVEVGPKEGVITAQFAADARGEVRKAELRPRGQMYVVGKLAVEDVILLPAPDRTSPRLDVLKGAVRAIGPTRMLTFVFDPLKETTQTQEGVKVTVAAVIKEVDNWTVKIHIENPPGGPKFETHQSWIKYNVLSLEKGQGKDRKVFAPESAEPMDVDQDSQRATLSYRLATAKGKPPEKGDWRLVYRTPARIVEVTAPFEFKNVALP